LWIIASSNGNPGLACNFTDENSLKKMPFEAPIEAILMIYAP
jgi:hypothetical protein